MDERHRPHGITPGNAPTTTTSETKKSRSEEGEGSEAILVHGSHTGTDNRTLYSSNHASEVGDGVWRYINSRSH
ncbi:hypothetical protein L484_023034 [Morus notabilis]|uniref:Uncharacterized protein n=1 Tax=Morus notabilis TaxID=981085 RepID=W9RKI7_9ROSA|nr:hypothetical protein L484_023034 [Morus notabilis]